MQWVVYLEIPEAEMRLAQWTAPPSYRLQNQTGLSIRQVRRRGVIIAAHPVTERYILLFFQEISPLSCHQTIIFIVKNLMVAGVTSQDNGNRCKVIEMEIQFFVLQMQTVFHLAEKWITR